MTAATRLKIRLANGSTEWAAADFSDSPRWQLQLTFADGRTVSVEQSDLFDCLVDLRKRLAEDGAIILCSGARRDVFPSGMARQMGGGRMAYQLRLGQQARRADLIDIFEPAEAAEIATVEDQRAFFDEWLASLGPETT